MSTFDLIVVGGGHAGAEAAAAAARLGRRVALVTLRTDEIGRLSCNPAVGGLGKGQLVREIDALGGLMAQAADASTIQFRTLNTRKGLAVRSSRAQVDIHRYPAHVQAKLESLSEVTVVQGEVEGLQMKGGRVCGVVLAGGSALHASAVVLTTGTFLSACMHFGEEQVEGGRVGSGAANALGQFLRDAGLRTIRLKTGTTPRVDGRTVDFSCLVAQEDTDGHFSFTPPTSRLPRVRCYLAETHEGTHDIIRGALDLSPMFSGQITGVGPRYCPSIEDKIVRFADRKRHLLFLEPEGLDTHRLYVNGMSTSLPRSVQLAMVRSVAGLETADILQYGYAVEYDAADPRDLDRGLQHRAIPGLYLAGQVNGTSGYEEAAAQGLLAGVSACLGEPFVLGRDQAYMGVLVDDLVTRGVGGEPYRMFTSRAEHRLRLREDNADRRLMPLAREMGLLGEAAWRAFQERQEGIIAGEKALSTRVIPDSATRARVEAAGLGPLRKACEARDLVKRPGVRYADVARVMGLPDLPPVVAEQVETDAKYAGYLVREEQRAAVTQRMASVSLATLDFQAVVGLSNEVRHRLEAGRPEDLASAARLPGMTPAAVTTLALHVAREMG